MSRNTEHQFVPTDVDELEALLVASYEKITKKSLEPGSPDKLFIKWVANIILHERVLTNYAANQNLPSRAEGKNLDAIAELFFLDERPGEKPAKCTERFYVSAPQEFPILVPVGTRVTDKSNKLIWETEKDVYVPAGDSYVDVTLICQTPGVVGNGYSLGQINTIVDVFDYYASCENITVSDDGSSEVSDDEFYELMRASMDAYSTAGARGAYVYFAKQVSAEIEDVVANSPSPGVVALYVLMNDGNAATEEMKKAVFKACNPDSRRAFTDYVITADPAEKQYDIEFTYYIPSNTTKSAAEIKEAVDEAVRKYILWQGAKFGRDINPDKLREYLSGTGIKRIEPISPSFTVLRDGKDNTVPEFAVVGNVSVTNGGYEDE